mgnify:CR=1 FL=1
MEIQLGLMSKITELPILERPREKGFRYGVEKLSNIELLAILIGSGGKDNSALDIAYDLLISKNGLFSLVNTPYQELTKCKGINSVKAIKLAACFELGKRYEMLRNEITEIEVNSEYIFHHVLPVFYSEAREKFMLVILNRKKQIVHEEILFLGAESNVPFSFKQVLSVLLIHKAHFFYIIHNHPGGLLEPSDNDLEITRKLIFEARKMGMKMLDHLIIYENSYCSMMEDVFEKKT